MNNKQKNIVKNPLEQLRDSGNSELFSNEILKPFANEFVSQIFGRKKFTGELELGEAIEMRSVITGKEAENQKEKQQISLERQLLNEEKVLVEKRSNELKVQIEAVQVQVTKLAHATPRLAREVEIASFQAPTHISMYELFFLKHLYKLIKDFTEDIEKAHTWLYTANSRARKQGNVWGENYKKHGARYLLSGEHYSGRSAA